MPVIKTYVTNIFALAVMACMEENYVRLLDCCHWFLNVNTHHDLHVPIDDFDKYWNDYIGINIQL